MTFSCEQLPCAAHPRAGAAGDELYEMANLYPRSTGLPMTVWISPRGNAHHDVRVNVSRQGGERMVIEDAASVAMRPVPKVMEGSLDTASLAAVSVWIQLNAQVLIEYWDGTVDTLDLAHLLKRV